MVQWKMVSSNTSFFTFRVIFHWTMTMAERVMFQMCFFFQFFMPLTWTNSRTECIRKFLFVSSEVDSGSGNLTITLVFFGRKKLWFQPPQLFCNLKNHPRNSANHPGEFWNFAFYFHWNICNYSTWSVVSTSTPICSWKIVIRRCRDPNHGDFFCNPPSWKFRICQ